MAASAGPLAQQCVEESVVLTGGILADTAAFARIAEAWAEHLVLRFSGQRITDDQLMEFSKRFGELDRVPIATAGLDIGNPEVRHAIAEYALEKLGTARDPDVT